ncbi:MAG: polyprenyl synthetase family protein [Candidatus Marsarchaeota archaeon]|nr:polyprenyl synthetase family protein [Candidatus Marsarchaeota archaeon]
MVTEEDVKKVKDASNIMEYLESMRNVIDKEIYGYLNDTTSPRNLDKLLGRSGYQYDQDALNKTIVEPANYLLRLGGKRLRAIFMLTALDALGKDPMQYLEFSIIPEIIHNGTLIHDDIEDDPRMMGRGKASDEIREVDALLAAGDIKAINALLTQHGVTSIAELVTKHKPSMRRKDVAVHEKFGLDIALNLGDFMFYFPMVALRDSQKLSQETKSRVTDIYQRDMLRIAGGQATDLAWHNALVEPYSVTEDKYLQMAYSKTGVLAGMSMKMGAAIAGANDETVDVLGRFGATIGVAFQIQDDILNITASKVSDTKGGIGEDITEGKITIMVIHALEKGSQEDRDRLIEILKSHTKDQDRINEAIAIMERYDSIAYADSIKNELVEDAWKRVDTLLQPSVAKDRLKILSEFAYKRTI